MAECGQSSALFRGSRFEVIPNGLDLSRYRPLPPDISRDVLGLPKMKKLIGFGAVRSVLDRRKGFHFLVDSLRALAATHLAHQTEVVIFGSPEPSRPLGLGLRTHYMGNLHDDISLALLYAACDIFVAPSVEDNLPNTLLEAVACGTPCVAFHIGGIPDVVEEGCSGYLADPFDVQDLTRGIVAMLSNPEYLARISKLARDKAEREFSMETVAGRHIALYEELLLQMSTASAAEGRSVS
jgi:glycosyltransferase involved in cell wall biosynthesis